MVSRDEQEYRLLQQLQQSALLYGKFWYSKIQRKQMDRKGYDRLFFKRLSDSKIMEYTEMVDAQALLDWPDDQCFYDDAIYLGEGHYHHRESAQ